MRAYSPRLVDSWRQVQGAIPQLQVDDRPQGVMRQDEGGYLRLDAVCASEMRRIGMRSGSDLTKQY